MKTDKSATLRKALKILEIEAPASYAEIKKQYKTLLKKWHPDKCGECPETCKNKTIEIIEAYKILAGFIENYKFKFDESEKGSDISVDEWWFKKFGNDSLWGQNK